MFDVSFTELMVIGIVALVVIGPERLPRVARTAGHLLGRLQRYVNNVKSDINREMHLEDLKRFEERVKNEVGQVQTAVNQELLGIQAGVESVTLPVTEASTASASDTTEAAVPGPLADASAVPLPLTFDAAKSATSQHV